MKFCQLIESDRKFIFLKNYTQNMVEKEPRPFLKITNLVIFLN